MNRFLKGSASVLALSKQQPVLFYPGLGVGTTLPGQAAKQLASLLEGIGKHA